MTKTIPTLTGRGRISGYQVVSCEVIRRQLYLFKLLLRICLCFCQRCNLRLIFLSLKYGHIKNTVNGYCPHLYSSMYDNSSTQISGFLPQVFEQKKHVLTYFGILSIITCGPLFYCMLHLSHLFLEFCHLLFQRRIVQLQNRKISVWISKHASVTRVFTSILYNTFNSKVRTYLSCLQFALGLFQLLFPGSRLLFQLFHLEKIRECGLQDNLPWVIVNTSLSQMYQYFNYS